MIDIESTNIGSHVLLITKDSKIILQQRDNKPGLINSGLISMFGGTLHEGEDQLNGLNRELTEELGDNFQNYQPQFLCTLYKTKELDGIDYTIHVYIINDVELKALDLKEGKAFVVDSIKNLLSNNSLTRITRLALQEYSKQLSC